MSCMHIHVRRALFAFFFFFFCSQAIFGGLVLKKTATEDFVVGLVSFSSTKKPKTQKKRNTDV